MIAGWSEQPAFSLHRRGTWLVLTFSVPSGCEYIRSMFPEFAPGRVEVQTRSGAVAGRGGRRRSPSRSRNAKRRAGRRDPPLELGCAASSFTRS